MSDLDPRCVTPHVGLEGGAWAANKVGLGTCTGSLAYMCRALSDFFYFPFLKLMMLGAFFVCVCACGGACMRHAVRYLRRNETDAAMRQSTEGLTLTFRLWLRDLTALLMMYVGEGGKGEGEGGVALTPDTCGV